MYFLCFHVLSSVILYIYAYSLFAFASKLRLFEYIQIVYSHKNSISRPTSLKIDLNEKTITDITDWKLLGVGRSARRVQLLG